jgi:hypothetical protein
MSDGRIKLNSADSFGYVVEKVDNTTIEIGLTQMKIRVRDGGITNPKIANGAVTGSKIADLAVGNSKLSDPTLRALAELAPQADKTIVGTGTTWTLRDAGAGVFRVRFDELDLNENGEIVVNHNLDEEIVFVSVYNATKKLVIPTEVQLIDEDNLSISLADFRPLTGTWSAIVIG